MNHSKTIHNEAIVIDCTCPLAALEGYLDNYKKGGVTVVAATVGYGMANIGTLDFTMKNLGKWFAKFKEDDSDLIHVKKVDDLYKAKKDGKPDRRAAWTRLHGEQHQGNFG